MSAVDPLAATYRDPEERYEPQARERIQRHHAMRLGHFRRMVHREVAIAAALDYCEVHDVALPAWVRREALEILCSLLKREKSSKRGRSNGALARYRQDMVDLERQIAVESLRNAQERLQREEDIVREADSSLKKDWNEYQRPLKEWVGHTLDRAFACASAELLGSDAYGGPAAVKASCLRVNKATSKGECRYLVLDYSILKRLDLAVLGAPQRGKVRKLSELYDLTPP